MISESFNKKLLPYLKNFDSEEINFIEKAFNFAKNAHGDVKRLSGELYFFHPLNVTTNILKHSPDKETVAAALLHDVIEDCDVNIKKIADIFNDDVSLLVDGVTKISSISMKKKALDLEFNKNDFSNQIDSYRKLLTAMAGDPRVLIIKLYDRLHNSETLEWMPKSRQKFYAFETIQIFASLAERIGMSEIKSELEDNCFPYAFPEEYKNFINQISSFKESRNNYIKEIIKKLSKIFPAATITGRAKHNFSLYNKLKEKGSLEKIYDLIAIRIIVATIPDCYKTLGIINSIYQPIGDRIVDYIAKPLDNGYQSLHTTVIGPEDQIFEVQIRTYAMHQISEFGIAAHWYYKEKKTQKLDQKSATNWMTELKTGVKIRSKQNFFANKIFVFSPKGKIIELKKGSTALDFAFHIHSDLGLVCYGAMVNSKIVPISQELQNGDIVEIIKNEKTKPSRDWLRIVRTSFARNKIREFFFNQDRPKFLSDGLSIINAELKRLGKKEMCEKNIKSFSSLIENSKLPFNDIESALISVAKKDTTRNSVIKVICPDVNYSDNIVPTKAISEKKVVFEIGSGFAYRLAQCCKPKNNSAIVGYITKQKSITVHKTTCHEISKLETKRIINAKWE